MRILLASDDALAWCLLAVVLSMLDGSATTAMVTIVGGVAYVGCMLTIGRRLLAPLGGLGTLGQVFTSGVVFALFVGASFVIADVLLLRLIDRITDDPSETVPSDAQPAAEETPADNTPAFLKKKKAASY